MPRENDMGQQIGEAIPDWSHATRPGQSSLDGQCCRLERLSRTRHAADLFEAFREDIKGANWTYIGVGPFASELEFAEWVEQSASLKDPHFYAMIDNDTGKAVGLAAYMRIKPEHGVIEVGHIVFSSRMQRTRMATEIMYLMMRHAFEELGYRRYEWKCDSLNAPSKRAAVRFGFEYDGLFKKAVIYKGRNRDTDWYSILDSGWPPIKSAFETWLDNSNFDWDGRQIRRLEDIRNGLD